MALVVQKYGGTSVANMERIRNVAGRVKKYAEKGDRLVVVVSAMAGETDRLIGLANQVSELHNEQEHDVLVATGEQVTSALLAMTLIGMGVPARSYQGHQVQICTDSAFTKARITRVDQDRLRRTLNEGKVAVVAGDLTCLIRTWLETVGKEDGLVVVEEAGYPVFHTRL